MEVYTLQKVPINFNSKNIQIKLAVYHNILYVLKSSFDDSKNKSYL